MRVRRTSTPPLPGRVDQSGDRSRDQRQPGGEQRQRRQLLLAAVAAIRRRLGDASGRLQVSLDVEASEVVVQLIEADGSRRVLRRIPAAEALRQGAGSSGRLLDRRL